MRLQFILAILLLMATQSFAQNKTQLFSNDTEEFLPQVEELFKSISDKKYAKSYIEELEIFWYNPDITDQDKKLIIDNCNLLALKRARPIPDYETYLNTIRDYILSDIATSSFNAWNSAIVSLLKEKRYPLRKINSLLITTSALLKDNIIYKTPSSQWKSSDNNWTLEFKDELIVKFNPMTLTCFSKSDSVKIYNTKGEFNYKTNIWSGENGKVTWQRAGFKPNQVYATFNEYSIPFKNASFEIKEVDFYNHTYFDHPLKGSLRHKVMNITNPNNATYPQFRSTQERFNLENIQPNVNYEGGFAQNGAKFLGAGTYEDPAEITILRNDTTFLTAKSLFFALRSDQILSTDTEIKMDLDTGFIYHPGLQFKYMVDNNELHLIRNGEGLSISPYFNTYHNVSMDIELLTWQLDSTIMDLKMVAGAAENHGAFESLSYFRESFYNQLQGMDAIHPLQGLKNCALYYGNNFTAKQYAQNLGLPEAQVRQQVINLSFYGFIGYNVNTDEIIIRQRLEDYLQFRLGEKDYDVIRFASNTPGNLANATLDLKNYDLNINGVKSISISDHQNVVFFPANENIMLKHNRNFVFDGAINAGMLNLFGNGFKFNYEEFLIEMTNIDSLRMKVQTGELDYFGRRKLTYVRNAIENLSGTLKIDEADNKSGTESYSQYPILNSTKESYVYYDKPEIQNGVYNREKFYFKLDTFMLDSISQLSRSNFDFTGSFVSNIFPTFDETLTVQPDFSLGFNRTAPAEGYGIYEGRATYFSNISQSNQGLRGSGILKYLTTTSASDDFLFLPEEVNGMAKEFTVEKREDGVEYPDVIAHYNTIVYKPYEDQLIAKSQEESFTMFNNEANLEGELVINKYGAKGKGTFYMDKANIVSPIMTFGGHTILADSSDFNLVLAENVQDVSFNTTNLISNIDFETRKGTFVSKSGGSLVHFTDNKYISYISEFSWDMDLNDIFMGTSGSEGNRFISTHRKQDSLEFRAPLARYDVENKIIYAEEVTELKVADAQLKLNDGFITIRQDADMVRLDSTTIVLADTSHTHTIYNATMKVEGKNAYSGYGEYNYVNGNGKNYKINLSEINLNENNRTIANGTIISQDLFTFDENFTFKGKANLLASDPLFTFKGGAQMLHQCNGGPQTFVYFEEAIDPNNVIIPIGAEPVNYDRDNIYRDFFLTKDSSHVYSSFLGSRKDYSDIPIITADEYLYFNSNENAFEISSMEKIANPDTTGTILRYSNTNCDIVAQGILNLGIDLGQVKTTASGTITDNPKKKDITLNTLFSLDFFFNEEASAQMVKTIQQSKAEESKISDDILNKRLSEWVGKKEAKTLTSKLKSNALFEDINPELKTMLLFGNIDFEFNGKAHTYIADGKADISFINGYAVNKQVDVKAEITKKRSGNSIEMFLQFDKDNWFFYSYKNGMMQTLSSSDAYNNTVQTLEAADRKLKVGITEKPYTFILSPTTKLNRFIKKFGLSPISKATRAAGQDIQEEAEEEEE
ncbi:hypothetical protein [Saccharicrinis aurantiacus]|uniref:hypothetical protein n=1 Tax=Saccharicrinis aurantiacus TaxID=1849719 RepID=UPI0024934E8C|nr:hypothetical protein [Saccharicrinis aurantiacus]